VKSNIVLMVIDTLLSDLGIFLILICIFHLITVNDRIILCIKYVKCQFY